MKRIFIVLFVSLCLSGCSVYMAAKQPDKKNLDLLNVGVDRNLLLAEFGKPETSEIRNGNRIDFFRFIQGYSQGAKTGRAIFHGVADVFTIGLWEVVGTPTESALDGTEMSCEITYDADDKVEKIVLFKGDNDPIVITSGNYEEEWLRSQETRVSGILATRLELFDSRSDIGDQMEQVTIPDGYAVVVGSSFISSERPYGVLPSIETENNINRYTSATVLKHLSSGKRFVLSGPRVHVYVVPAGEYEVTSVIAEFYSDAELQNAKMDKSDSNEKLKGASGVMFAFQDVAGSVLDTVYSPVSSIAGEKSRMAWKVWEDDTAQNFSRLELLDSEITYLGHIQTHTLLKNRLFVDIAVFDEMDEANEMLKKSYPLYAKSLSKKLIQFRN